MNVKRYKVEIVFLKIIKFILLFIVTIIIYSLCYDETYKIISLLPFSYMVVDFFYISRSNDDNKYIGGLIYRIALIVIFIRYVVTPLSIALTGEFYASYNGYRIYTSEESIKLAVFLMIFELIGVYIILFFATKYYSKKYSKIISNKAEPINNKFVLLIFALFVIIILLLTEPNLLIPTDFLILSKEFQKIQLNTSYDGVYYILARLVKPVVFLILFSNFKEKYDINHKKIYIWLSCILVILFMGLYTDTQRWEIVFAGIVGIYLLKVTYNNIPRMLILVVIIIMSISFLSISLYKFSWAIQTSVNPVKDVIIEMLGMFQEYFSGPRVVANSIEMYNVYGKNINLSTFINDFTGSIPGVSKYVDQSDRINTYFNMYHNRPYGHTPLIIPMVGIGYSYFPIFPPIFTMICYWFIIKFDYKLEASNSIEFKYLYLYPGLYLAMSMGFNTQIIFTTFLQRFLPLFILFKINQSVCFSSKYKLH